MNSRNLFILLDAGGTLQVRDVDTRKRPAPCKGANFLAKVDNLLRTNLALLLNSGHTDEVLEEFGASLTLESGGSLDGTVKEVSDNLDVLLLHVTGSEGRGTETDATRYLRRRITRDGVFCTSI